VGDASGNPADLGAAYWVTSAWKSLGTTSEDVGEGDTVERVEDLISFSDQATAGPNYGYNGPTLAAGPALEFVRASDQRLRAKTAPSLNAVSGVTMFFAGRFDDTSDSRVVSSMIAGSTTAVRAMLSSEAGGFGVSGRRLDADSFQMVSGGAVVAGAEVVLVGVLNYASGTASLWADGIKVVDGVAFQTPGLSDATSSTVNTYGAGGASPTDRFDGKMRDAGIFEKALTDAEVVAMTTYLQARAANPPMVIPETTHGWHGAPWFADLGDRVLVAGAGQAGNPTVAEIFPNGIRRRVRLPSTGIDDHNIPAITDRTDGKVHAIWTRHATENFLRQQISATAGEIDFPGTDTTVATSATAGYTQVIDLGGGNLWCFYRTGNSSSGQWNVVKSADNGSTWGTAVQWWDVEYVHTYLIGTNIHCVATILPSAVGDQDIRYVIIDSTTGDIDLPDGTTLDNLWAPTSLPIALTDGFKAVDVASGTGTRLLGEGQSSGGNFCFVGVEYEQGDVGGTYYLYRYKDSSSLFDKHELGPTGGTLRSPSNTYWGGAAITPNDDQVIYICDIISVKNLTLDGSYDVSSSANIATREDSANKLARPNVFGGVVYYTEFSDYNSYSDWDGDIKTVSVT